MKKRSYFLLYLIGVAVAALAATGQPGPGYMDADYYYAGGIQIASGKGFYEPFLWNYLDDPTGLPHPSHLYWMPLPSVIAAAGMRLAGTTGFWGARLPFILIAGLLPVLSASLSTYFLKDQKYFWLGGLLGVFTGIYVVYASIPETFMLYLVLGGLFFWQVFRVDWQSLPLKNLLPRALMLGLLAGLMHLSRSDGILWAVGGAGWLIYAARAFSKTNKIRIAIFTILIFIFGYGMIMSPWYARNLELFGSFMVPGNSRTLWLTNYNQTFAYPADNLTFSNWLKEGMAVHLQGWITAVKMNIQNLVAVQGMVILLPLMVSGLWIHRKKAGVIFAIIMWALTFLLMTFVFPYAGARGGYLHSASAFQVLLWSVAPAGLEEFVAWGQQRRNWQPEKSMPVFATLLVVFCFIMTGWFYLQKIFGDGNPESRWGADYTHYSDILDDMAAYHWQPGDLVLVNNPPGFYVATAQPSIVIPGGGIDQAQAAAKRYGAKYMILEEGQENLQDLYLDPADTASFYYLGELHGAKIFCFECQ